MKSIFRAYLIVWSAIFVLFNVISFVFVGVFNDAAYSVSFWIGYSVILLALFGQVACSFILFKEKNANKTFLNLSLAATAYAGLGTSFVVGCICMLVPFIPFFVGAIACAIILVCNFIAVIKTLTVVEAVAKIDEKIKANTMFVRSLTLDLEGMMHSAQSDAVKAECRRAYEAVRYSDPMSHASLVNIEKAITKRVSELSYAVSVNDANSAALTVNFIVGLIGERNNKCRLLK